MSALDPIVLTHEFVEDANASGMVDVAELDAQLALIVAGHAEHSDLLATLLRGDLTLKDGLIRSRNLHPEVITALQLLALDTAHALPTARVASTGNLTLSGTQTIDGVACIVGDVVLAKDQTDEAENGLWTIAAGAWARTTDTDTWDDLLGGLVWVDEGTASEGTQWAMNVDAGGTIDVDPVAAVLLFRAASSLANLDPNAVPTAVPDFAADYALIHDVSAGALRRALLSAFPFLSDATTHGDLAGLDDDDHPQYHDDARGDARYAPLAHEHSADDTTAGVFDPARLPEMVGATAVDDGTAGAVPEPAVGDRNSFLKGDGTWGDPVASAPGVARAWVVFAGSGSNGAQTLIASHNIVGVNRDSSGVYTVTIAPDVFADGDYAMVGSAKRTASNKTVVVGEKDDETPTATEMVVEIKAVNDDGDVDLFQAANPTRVSLLFFGDAP